MGVSFAWIFGLVVVVISEGPDFDFSNRLGHMRELGWGGPTLPVEEIHDYPDPETFYLRYSKGNRPVVIKGGARVSPAFSKWTDEYLSSIENATNEPVLADTSGKKTQFWTFGEYLEFYKKEKLYMVYSVPKALRSDVHLPPPLRCGGYEDKLADTVMWFSNGGTKTVLHIDDVDNINCVFSGSKEALMIEYPKYKDKVKLDPRGGYSNVDVDKVDFNQFPEFSEIEYHVAKIESGDCFFMPLKWFHVIRSYERNIAVNIWYKPLEQFNRSDCEHLDSKPDPPSLDKYFFKSEDGAYTQDKWPQRRENDEKEEEDDGPPDDLREYFSNMIEDESSSLTLVGLVSQMRRDKKLMSPGIRWISEMDDIAAQFFAVLDSNSDGFIYKEEIYLISPENEEKLEELASSLEDYLDMQKKDQ
ncbi:tRNA wybutosine-synthesizing protein 5-like isoform X2 [Oscarella lobularis]|uniref:tRNA wybutosine-synthesizing protein 5-like isoform X2 n=1 Tax=Oscarella lobularis TaxID=121494 RepID=UPI003314487C